MFTDRRGAADSPLVSFSVLHRDLPTIAADYDDVIIDGAPRSYEVTRSAIAAADIVVIPVQPSGAALWASKDTVGLATEMGQIKETQKAVFLVSRRIGKTAIGQGIDAALLEMGLPVMESGTAQRIVYAEAFTAGTTVIELQPKGAAAKEIRAIARELKEIVG